MTLLGMKIRHLLLLGLLLTASLLFDACAKKAIVIQAGVTQFEAESLD
jgi:hypothetical protein